MKTKTTNNPKKVALSLDTLGDLNNGAAGIVIAAALKAAVRDIEDRGSDKKPRKVVIEIELKKLSGDAVTAGVKVKTSLPPYQTEPTIGEFKVSGGEMSVEFNPLSGDNPDQMTIDDGE